MYLHGRHNAAIALELWEAPKHARAIDARPSMTEPESMAIGQIEDEIEQQLDSRW